MAMLHLVLYTLATFASPVFTRGPRGGPQWDPSLPAECIPQRLQQGYYGEVCCPLPRFGPAMMADDTLRNLMRSCMEEFQSQTPSVQSGGVGGFRGNKQCMEECIFNKDGLLTTDMKLNGEEVRRKMIQVHGGDPSWDPTLEQGIAYCLQTAPGEVLASSQCQSGSMEFKRCLMRYLFANCPTNLWNNSEACTAEKSLLERCPNLKPRRSSIA